MKHSIQYFEIPVDDFGKGLKFYEDVFGWDLKKMPDFDYAQVYAEGDGIDGGICPRAEKREPGRPLMYITVDDITEHLKIIEANGGQTLTPRTAIPGAGFFGIFSDPSGNWFGLWEQG